MTKCKMNLTKDGKKKGHAWVRNERGEVRCEKCGVAQRDNGLDVASFESGAYKLKASVPLRRKMSKDASGDIAFAGVIVIFILIFVGVGLLLAFALLWALNTLGITHIDVNFWTILAVFVILLVIGSLMGGIRFKGDCD